MIMPRFFLSLYRGFFQICNSIEKAIYVMQKEQGMYIQ